MELTADALVAALREKARPGEAVQKHYHGDGDVLGVPMKATFDTSKAFTDLPLTEVDRLLDETSYEARLAAFCVLDFRARRAKLPDDERRAGYELYLRRHDAIDSWDMVDRAAPHVVGRYLLKRSRDPLFELARTTDPLRRRTAITAPLYFARFGTAADLTDLFALAELLLDDSDPVVSKPVGIALKYAGVMDEAALTTFLDQHAGTMQRPALRYALEKLDPATRKAYLG
ncbi:DNA alkylation repair protein [Kribbella sp. VKM Ac-2568]|uniref:DNA alkylation repair protein n=1 Tax=Kribbella sp. VKM Ac-2568 TaxID=2512219 RepID=UPI001050976B|nr:DNA alkylation repair protein [Kribbella sp. VKM Ac-2568]TCM41816.1 DNA alkylation repair enzyme [Kribbella sp. VKM Ac-2568]